MSSPNRTEYPARSPVFASDRILSDFWRLSLPTLIALMINAMVPLMDSFFIGVSLGTQGIAALAWGFAVIMFVISAGTWFSYGTAPKVSFSLGRENLPLAKSWMIGGIVGAMLFGSVLTLIVLSSFSLILPMMTGDAVTAGHLLQYVRIASPGFPFLMGSIVAASALNAQGKARLSLIGSAASLVAGFAGNWLLIIVFPFGIVGAALGTVAGQFIGFAVNAYFLFTGGLKLTESNRLFYRIARIMVAGFPVFMANSLGTILVFLFNAKSEEFGGALALAVFGVGFQIYRMALVMVLAFAQGMQPMISFFAGAGDTDSLRRTFITAITASAVSALLLFLGIQSGLDTILKTMNSDPAFIREGTDILRPAILALPFLGITVVGSLLFQYLQKTGTSLFLQAVKLLGLQVPLTFVLPSVLGLVGLAIVLPVAEVLSMALVVWMLLRLVKAQWGLQYPIAGENLNRG